MWTARVPCAPDDRLQAFGWVSIIRRLADGFYEEVVTGDLVRALDLVANERHIDARALGDDAHVILARLLRGQIERAFADVGGSGEDRLARQVQLADELLGVLEAHRLVAADQRISPPAAREYARPTRRRSVPCSSNATKLP